MGDDPVSGKPMVVKSGRYGPYVTDGETNASVPKGTDPATLSLDDALGLLEARRGAAPRAGRRRNAPAAGARKRATKKPAAAATDGEASAAAPARKAKVKARTVKKAGSRKRAGA
jgi:DNA topoisomerase-1